MFGYGSLLSEPEWPERLAGRAPATLPGVRRGFVKRSVARGCPVEEAFDVETLPGFEADGRRHSLALGTVDGGSLRGEVLWYAGTEAEILARLDRREGFDPAAPVEANGYARRRVEVVGEARWAAWTWLANPGGRFDAVALSRGERAQVLVAATPRAGSGEHARGLDYLEGVRCRLATLGIIDPELEALAAEVRRRPGPWVARVAEPRA